MNDSYKRFLHGPADLSLGKVLVQHKIEGGGGGGGGVRLYINTMGPKISDGTYKQIYT